MAAVGGRGRHKNEQGSLNKIANTKFFLFSQEAKKKQAPQFSSEIPNHRQPKGRASAMAGSRVVTL
jgi:hypothetical protein